MIEVSIMLLIEIYLHGAAPSHGNAICTGFGYDCYEDASGILFTDIFSFT